MSGEGEGPAIVEVRGLKIAFLGYLILGAAHPEPPVVWATETTAGVAATPDGAQVVDDLGEVQYSFVEVMRAHRGVGQDGDAIGDAPQFRLDQRADAERRDGAPGLWQSGLFPRTHAPLSAE